MSLDKWKGYTSRGFAGKVGSISDVYAINLILGRACNMHCPHCNQNHPDMFSYVKDISNEFIRFVACWSKSGRIKKNFCFWGGEPLVYWDKIVEIISRLENEGIFSSDINYMITTNGLLFDEKKMDYMYKHGFRITFSYDAPNPTMIRSDAPSQHIIDLFNSYPGNKKISCVYAAATPSMVIMYKELARIFPGVPRMIGAIRTGEGVPDSVGDLTAEKVRRDLIELYRYYLDTGEPDDLKMFFKGALMRESFNDVEFNTNFRVPYCTSTLGVMSMDLNCNLYSCMVGNNKLGSLLHEDFFELQKKAVSLWTKNIPDKCIFCKYLGYCPAGCLEYVEKNGVIKGCEYYKTIYEVSREIMIEGKIY